MPRRGYARAEAGPWSAPTSVAQGFGWFVNWADFPSLLALQDGALYAHWLAKSAGHGYDVRSEHGFVSLVPWPGGGTGVVWLDGRGAADVSPADAAMRLMQTTLDGSGRLGTEATLDPRVCDCCQTAAGDVPRVRLVLSGDGGRSFGAPVEIDDGRPIGRVDVALLPEGDALVSWLEQTPTGAELRVRAVDAAGARQPSLAVADSSSARSSGFPRLELAGSEPVLAWRDVREPARVVSARLLRD